MNEALAKHSVTVRRCLRLAAVLTGVVAMGTESVYPRTVPGAFEVKELPAALSLKAVSAQSYFGTENGLFLRLFRFIRDNEVAMTVPVEVELEPGVMRFYVGAEDSRRPLKSTASVALEPRAKRTVAALGVRGAYSPEKCREAIANLRQWVRRNSDIEAVGEPYMVYWSSPFVPGFLKTSEAHVPVRRQAPGQQSKEMAEMARNALTPEEEWVIARKGTEQPFSGRFVDHKADGTYVCRRCNAPLYVAGSKFASGCGWPSFDEELPGAVKRVPDADGRRTEIVCARCEGHLGHVFTGEGYTPKNTRHCVNSLSLDFVPAEPSRLKRAVFASGCFWGTEYVFQRAPGVVSTRVGYTGGKTEDPTYKDVCSGQTGHAEAIEIVYDPDQTTYEALCRLFFETHDPTQVNRQGPDVGTQYRSAVFYADAEQKAAAEKLIGVLRAKGLDVATTTEPAGTFWPGEDYHQNYYNRTGRQPYCHVHTPRFAE
jgi:peptide methionine sulfoxide reductase msrA/msrB